MLLFPHPKNGNKSTCLKGCCEESTLNSYKLFTTVLSALFVNVHSHDDDDGDIVEVLRFTRPAQSPKNILRAVWFHVTQELNVAEGTSIGPGAQAVKTFHYARIVKCRNVSHSIGNKKFAVGLKPTHIGLWEPAVKIVDTKSIAWSGGIFTSWKSANTTNRGLFPSES